MRARGACGSAIAVFVLFPIYSIKVPNIICDVYRLRYTYTEFAIATCTTQVKEECEIIVRRVCGDVTTRWGQVV